MMHSTQVTPSKLPISASSGPSRLNENFFNGLSKLDPKRYQSKKKRVQWRCQDVLTIVSIILGSVM